jgi:DNA helicase-2/ATP-dependent DNA helicase PcrA
LHPLLAPLTEAQREAVTHVDGPLLIVAGPGSGKTRVVTHRIAWLIEQGVSSRRILALTFTNKAADEMQARVEALAPGQAVWMSTFHRFCARLLRQYGRHVGLAENYTIYDAGDSRSALKRAMQSLDLDQGRFTPERVAGAISWAKNNLVGPEQYQPRPGHALGAVVAQIYPAYESLLLRANAVDFDDLLLHTAALLRDHPEIRQSLDERYQYVMVDEYQDTNLAQYAIVRALSIDHPNLAVTGDPDQSIYGWRGANLGNILEFERDFPQVRVVRLEQNYRSTQRILHVADRLIVHNRRRKEKALFTENPEGRPVGLVTYITQRDEAESIAARIAGDVRAGRRRLRDFAIFYRMNALSRSLETALRQEGLAYQMVNGLEFLQRKEIKDVLAYLQLVANPRNDVAFERIVNTPPRGIGRTTLERLSEHAARYRTSLLEAAREAGLIESLNPRAAVAVARFVALVDRLGLLAAGPVEEIVGHVLSETGYQQSLEESESPEEQDRLANIEELLTVAREFDERNPGQGQLERFLEETSLAGDTDDWESEQDRVTMMTLHAAKGLEFPVVFIVALEDGILPHERSREAEEQLEEERRLLFVGMTRAKEELELSRAMHRDFRGQRRMSVPSQFLMELPRDQMRVVQPRFVVPAELVPSEAAPGRPRTPRAAAEPSAGGPWPTAAGQPLSTAAELAGQPSPTVESLSPEVFHQGMIVRHPEYGLGKIVALSGIGPRRVATVAFASRAGEKKFMLRQSPLRPAKNGSD